MMDLLKLSQGLKNVSADELRVAVPLMVVELDELYSNVLKLLDNITSIREIIEEVVDEDKNFKRGESE
jgi:hypothetical protein